MLDPAPARRERARSGRVRLPDLALLLTSALLTLLACEALLRGLGVGGAMWAEYVPHSELGWTSAPLRSGRLATNSLGFRDVEHALAKPGGTRRLLVLGDSFTAATQVGLEQSYPRILQRLLDERAAERWEVMSLAANGWGTAQEWLALERYGLAYAPDAVILQFFPNDVCNNALSAADLCAFHDDMRPYFVEHAGGLRLVWTDPMRRRLRLDSVLYRLFERGLEDLRLRWRLGTLGHAAASDIVIWRHADQADRLRGDFGAVLHPFFYTYAADADQIPPVAEGWRMTERIIEEMARELRRSGIPLVLVAMPYDGAVDASAWEARWQAEPRPPVPLERDYPERRIARLGERLGIPVSLLLESFEQRRDVVLPYRMYHLNAGGHRVAAEVLYERLVGAGLVPERARGPDARAGPGACDHSV